MPPGGASRPFWPSSPSAWPPSGGALAQGRRRLDPRPHPRRAAQRAALYRAQLVHSRAAVSRRPRRHSGRAPRWPHPALAAELRRSDRHHHPRGVDLGRAVTLCGARDAHADECQQPDAHARTADQLAAWPRDPGRARLHRDRRAGLRARRHRPVGHFRLHAQ